LHVSGNKISLREGLHAGRGIAGLATCTLYILVSYLLPTNLRVKGIMPRDEYYFFEAYINKMVLSVCALTVFTIFSFLVEDKKNQTQVVDCSFEINN
jgi:hypothetical protein